MASHGGPKQVLKTERLTLVAANIRNARAVADFFEINRAHLEPWSPLMPPDLFTLEGQTVRMRYADQAFNEGTAWRWNMFLNNSLERVIGYAHFSQVVRGVFQSTMLGYAIGSKYEGKGYMTEALQAMIDELFSERGRLHRIQANVIPTNTKSLALLERLGFQREGLAKHYLFINGKWQDHVMTALLNPNYPEDGIW